ncbi:MAG: FAD:protein FMN transferase [Nitrospira sp.]
MSHFRFEFEAIGTSWKIDITKELSKDGESLLLEKIKERIRIFDLTYSRFKENSIVTKMSKESGSFTLPEDADKMITTYRKIYDVTGGLVTPLIGKVLIDAGYDADYSLQEKTLSKPKDWDEVMKWDKPILTIHQPTMLDFGAGGKGYLVDIVSEIIENEGIKTYCVDAGGDMRYRDEEKKTLRVGLENPNDQTEVIGVAELSNKSLCGSSGNRRKWGKFHHVINPETLTSPENITAVWTVAENTMLADILTTGLFFVEPEKLLGNFQFDYLILYSDYSIKKSEGFKAEIFS